MRRKRVLMAIAAGAAFLVGFLSSIESAPAQERFDLKVRQDFFAGFAGNQDALNHGMKACEDALAADPKNAEAMVWHGSGVLFEAGQYFQTGDQQKGMEFWTRGLKEMQTAVDLQPDRVAVRIPRGAVLLSSSHYVPESMAKPLIETGLSDYARSYEIQKDDLPKLGTHSEGELLFGLAEGYSRAGNQEKATEFFEKIRADLPNTEYAKRADLWMETKSLPVNRTRCVGCHAGK